MRVLTKFFDIVSVDNIDSPGMCQVCAKYDINTKYSRMYQSLKSLPQSSEEDMISVDDNLHSDLIASCSVSEL